MAKTVVKDLRESSTRQYQTSWASFTEYIKVRDTQEITQETVLSFMRHLFTDKNFAPATVATYKTALAEPLLVQFDVNVSDPIFNKCMSPPQHSSSQATSPASVEPR